ncbi:Uncharacterised protein [Zhongshania aliphaticivorans]|uniref:Uncharacterized protein n=1 Tax=Zhongshania aliphaticivorans TaxID=1470434 RepID=A0A5S9PHC6_9GAMM|nr:hypothetical protein [Zhongshania aliphaticivorans]CAA0103217.1 Uncharacterised protein [Zhongshania aliphaticivorans]CAA0113676.1 Uncharacterised protein [Zhongshania aliphaticivorans]
MAFDYGSIDLGLKNPFKLEGAVIFGRSLLQTFMGLFLLISAAGLVNDDAIAGWILMVFGVGVLGWGVAGMARGIYAVLRYFVGRNHPSSLAVNRSKSEASTAAEEAAFVNYTSDELEEMLVGRKNGTFVEPRGFLARSIHSILPNLLFMPYPIRNMAQNLFAAWVSTVISLLAYALVAFVTLAGFAGDAGRLIFPVYSALLMFFVVYTWWQVGRPIVRRAERNIEAQGGGELVKVISLSLIAPVIFGVAMSWLISLLGVSSAEIDSWLSVIPSLHAVYYLIAVLLLAFGVSALILLMLQKRLDLANPVVEVSELRENWQESVHPNEIFINLDNLVMANRRYKEVPNRVYRELDPELREHIDGKGGFKGEMIQEVQPKVKPMDLGPLFEQLRFVSLISGNALFVIATILTLFLAYQLVDIYVFAKEFGFTAAPTSTETIALLDLAMTGIHFLLVGIVVRSFARLLTNNAHVFFAEIQFESLLVYFKCEGTFTESKISTGTGIHDSTRSENTLVRSSITPWVIVSKIVSTTFAATGMKNLEHPRYVLEMYKDEDQLQDIKRDVVSFLKDRESIAAITSQRDLGNASQIYQLNQQTRAAPPVHGVESDSDAAGYLRKEDTLQSPDKD